MDGLLVAGTLFAGLYCFVLSRRVRALKSLDSGLGGAIVSLTRQIELARTTLEEARAASTEGTAALELLVARANTAAAQLRLLLVASKEPLSRPRPSRPDAEPAADERPSHEPASTRQAPRDPLPAQQPPPDPMSARQTPAEPTSARQAPDPMPTPQAPPPDPTPAQQAPLDPTPAPQAPLDPTPAPQAPRDLTPAPQAPDPTSAQQTPLDPSAAHATPDGLSARRKPPQLASPPAGAPGPISVRRHDGLRPRLVALPALRGPAADDDTTLPKPRRTLFHARTPAPDQDIATTAPRGPEPAPAAPAPETAPTAWLRPAPGADARRPELETTASAQDFTPIPPEHGITTAAGRDEAALLAALSVLAGAER